MQNVGIVKFYHESKGFGFIDPGNGGNDVFFHFSGVIGGADEARHFQKQTRVSYEIERDWRDGRPFAINIRECL